MVGSLLGLFIYARLTDLDAGVQAPLYALITATGLAVVLGARADQIWDRNFNWLVRVAVIFAAVFSAYQWLLNEDAGTVIELVGAAGAVLALIAFWVNIGDVETTIEKQDRCDGGSD